MKINKINNNNQIKVTLGGQLLSYDNVLIETKAKTQELQQLMGEKEEENS